MVDVFEPYVFRATDAYEAYVGRWSRPLAEAFLAWFAVPTAGRWLDVGCGTGALTEAILDATDPITVVGIDPSPEFLGAAQRRITDPRSRPTREVSGAGKCEGWAGESSLDMDRLLQPEGDHHDATK